MTAMPRAVTLHQEISSDAKTKLPVLSSRTKGRKKQVKQKEGRAPEQAQATSVRFHSLASRLGKRLPRDESGGTETSEKGEGETTEKIPVNDPVGEDRPKTLPTKHG